MGKAAERDEAEDIDVMDVLDDEDGAGDDADQEQGDAPAPKSRKEGRLHAVTQQNKQLREKVGGLENKLANLEGKFEMLTRRPEPEEEEPEDPEERRLHRFDKRQKKTEAELEQTRAELRAERAAREKQQMLSAALSQKGMKWADPSFAQDELDLFLRAYPSATREQVEERARNLHRRLHGAPSKQEWANGKREVAAKTEVPAAASGGAPAKGSEQGKKPLADRLKEARAAATEKLSKIRG
jgi:hypothetical protein